MLHNITPQAKRAILKAMSNGLLTKDEVLKPDFKPHLYTLTDLPLFAFKESNSVKFMNEGLTEEQYNLLIQYYSETGNTQNVIMIE
jgi:hypothetical protein